MHIHKVLLGNSKYVHSTMYVAEFPPANALNTYALIVINLPLFFLVLDRDACQHGGEQVRREGA